MLVLSGDFDASGMDISRSFVEMTSCWKKVHRIGLDEGLITRYGLPVLQGKATDSRAADFIAAHPEIHARHGFGADEKDRPYPVQVEPDAVNPGELRGLYQRVIRPWGPPGTAITVTGGTTRQRATGRPERRPNGERNVAQMTPG